MKNIRFSYKIWVLAVIAGLLWACEDMDDKPLPGDLEIKEFIWRGLNLYYLWQEEVNDLADNRFPTQNQFIATASGFASPQDWFRHLLVPPPLDRFSVIFSDFTVLEAQLQGTSKSNGVDFELRLKPGSTTEVFGWVRYILPNSDASNKPIFRGDFFYAVNGTPLNTDNFRSLLNADSYTLNLADFDNGNITPNGQSVSLTRTEYAENPIFIHDVIDIGNAKVAYLMYNGFFSSFDAQLNQVFGQFQAQGATHLVLDLRYNSGGALVAATRLASMITGQFTGQVFSKQQWNAKANAFFQQNNPDAIVSNFTNTIGGQMINSLQLTKVYILTSRSTASASELLINGLRPYIDVVQIGTTTTGKNVGSVTLYDSPTFGRQNINPRHRFAMQPITFRVVNRDNFGDYPLGLDPNIDQAEDFNNLGVLGNVNEPLLSTALSLITGGGRGNFNLDTWNATWKADTKSLRPFGNELYMSLD